MRRWTIHEARAAIVAGRVTPLELTEQCLERIDQFEPQVHAWAHLDRQGALELAHRRTQQVRQGQLQGDLHGIPLGIKDIFDVAGMPTCAGSSWMHELPTADATLVARLRQHGAVILGKTVTTEFAGFDPPPTCNPWNLDRTPGGSSSGSAAAVALGMCLGAMGSQTGGSITRPASFCGVAGCKPELGRISVHGTLPIAFQLDHPGPIATCTADLRTLVAAIEGADSNDPLSEDFPPIRGRECCQSGPAPVLAVLEGFFLDEASAEVRRLFEASVARLQEAGAVIRRVNLPESFADLHRHHGRIMAVEGAMTHRHWYAEHGKQYGPNFASMLDDGNQTDVRDYVESLAHRRRFQHEIRSRFAGAAALLTPSTVTTAPGRETTGDSRFNAPWSYAGLPTVSVPCGLDEHGLPASLQLSGPRGGLDGLLTTAHWCERPLHFDRLPPLLNHA